MSDFKYLLDEAVDNEHVLSSTYEIEDVLLLIQEINRKVDFYKNLKTHRVRSIDQQMAVLSAKSDIMRKIILNTMSKIAPDDKTINFPSIGKVSRRAGKIAHEISDQEKVISFLDDKGLKSECVIEEPRIDKRRLNTIIGRFKKEGTKLPGITSSTGPESVSITFEKPKTLSGDDPQEHVISTEDQEALDTLLV